MNQELINYRLSSAKQSGGISAGPIYDLVIKICEKHAVKGRLLDYGAGIGQLLEVLQTRLPHLDLNGADILPRPLTLNPTVNWFEGDLNQPLPQSDANYDTIVSAEVIEHLENPRSTFRDLNRLLKPGGLLIVTTPNQESLRSLLALLMTGHYVAFSDQSYPAHITALLRKDFQRIAQETGLEVLEFAFTNQGGIPKLPRLKWQKLFPFLKGRRFSDNVAVVFRKVSPS